MLKSNNDIRLLPEQALVKTGEVDRADWNFRPILGRIQRLRFKLAIELMSGCHCPRLLEIGYGSGVFLPELSRHCDALYGIDPHPRNKEVAQVLRQHGVDADLISHSVESMPFDDGFFDCVVAISSLEYVKEIRAACAEVRRTLKRGGSFFVVSPGHSTFVDLGVKLLTGEDATTEFGDRRQRVIPTLVNHFVIEKRRTVDLAGLPFARLYTALELRSLSAE